MLAILCPIKAFLSHPHLPSLPDCVTNSILYPLLQSVFTAALTCAWQRLTKTDPFKEYIQVDLHVLDDNNRISILTLDDVKVLDVLHDEGLCNVLKKAGDALKPKRDLDFVTMDLADGSFWIEHGKPVEAWKINNQVLKHISSYCKNAFLAGQNRVPYQFAIIHEKDARGGANFRVLLMDEESLRKLANQKIKKVSWEDWEKKTYADWTHDFQTRFPEFPDVTVVDKHRTKWKCADICQTTFQQNQFPLCVIFSKPGTQEIMQDKAQHHRRLVHLQEMAYAMDDSYDGVLTKGFSSGQDRKWMRQILLAFG